MYLKLGDKKQRKYILIHTDKEIQGNTCRHLTRFEICHRKMIDHYILEQPTILSLPRSKLPAINLARNWTSSRGSSRVPTTLCALRYILKPKRKTKANIINNKTKYKKNILEKIKEHNLIFTLTKLVQNTSIK